MAAIDPADTTEVPAAQAQAALAANRRTRRARPDTPAQQPPQAPAATADPLGGMSPEQLERVMRALGYGDQQGPAVVDADPLEGQLIELVRTGWVRVPAPVSLLDDDGKPAADTPSVYRLRRPLLGELRRIRLAHEAATDEIDEARIVFLEADQTHRDDVAYAKAELQDPDRSRAILRSKRTHRKAEHALNEVRDRVLVEWWAQVFRILCVDGPWSNGTMLQPAQVDGEASGPPVPNGWDWEPWAVDEALTVTVLNHWRSVPLAPGR